ncbi:hypothetical protein ACFX2J_005123 [Malus domestica]
MAGMISAEEATVNLSLPDCGTPIPSGDQAVWADVSPLLDAACKDLQDGHFFRSFKPVPVSNREARETRKAEMTIGKRLVSTVALLWVILLFGTLVFILTRLSDDIALNEPNVVKSELREDFRALCTWEK